MLERVPPSLGEVSARSSCTVQYLHVVYFYITYSVQYLYCTGTGSAAERNYKRASGPQ